MTLFELTRDLLVYLIHFREQAPTTAAPPLGQVRQDLLAIFQRMDQQAQGIISLSGPYDQVRYFLVALADDIAISSGWDQSKAWRRDCLEKQLYNTDQGATRFFELLEELEHPPQDVLAIIYLCLGLGFCGCHHPDDPELIRIKQELSARLPTKTRAKAAATPKAKAGAARASSEPSGKKKAWFAGAGAVAALALVLVFVSAQNQEPVPRPPAGQEAVAPAKSRESKPTAATKTPPAQSAPRQEMPVKQPEEPKAAPAAIAQTAPQPTEAAAPAPSAPPAPSVEPAPAAAPAAVEKPSPVIPSPAPAPRAAQPLEPIQTALVEPAPKPAKSPAKAQAAPAPKPAAPATGYFIQVGVFVGPKQSGRLARRLSDQGWPGKVERQPRKDGPAWYGVVIGPLQNYQQAQAIKSSLRQEFGIKGIVRKRTLPAGS